MYVFSWLYNAIKSVFYDHSTTVDSLNISAKTTCTQNADFYTKDSKVFSPKIQQCVYMYRTMC